MKRTLFYTKHFFQLVALTLYLLSKGEWKRVIMAIHARLYIKGFELIFPVVVPFARLKTPCPNQKIERISDHPIAYESPDHIAPYGTQYNNSTNKKFVLMMNDLLKAKFPDRTLQFMDLGCSGGQLVADFQKLNWQVVGLEGSDYSLKHRRANWRSLGNKNLFTCDITKKFLMKTGGLPLKFHLITAWEVLEHIHPNDLPQLFKNISDHLQDGGFFIASTCSGPSIVDGIELHQTRMSNSEWKRYLTRLFPEFVEQDLGLEIYQFVRYDFAEPSFLVYKKINVRAETP